MAVTYTAVSIERRRLSTLTGIGRWMTCIGVPQQGQRNAGRVFSMAEITALLRQLGLTDARKLMRHGEPEYAALDLANPALGQPELIAAMADNPKLIERPVFISGDKAVIGRPPERVLALL